MAFRTSTLPLLLAASTLCGLLAPVHSGAFLQARQTTKGDADASLASELADTVDKARLAELEGALRSTYASLPKDARGNLGHKAVRYVLHRLFVQRHGWYIKGLEPDSDDQYMSMPNASLKEWVPSFLQDRLERRSGNRGTSLRELAALAAALEDLVGREATERLHLAYRTQGLSLDGTIQRDELDTIIETYYMVFLAAGTSATGGNDVEAEKSEFAARYTGWAEAKEWLEEAMGGVRAPEREGQFNFSAATRMALKIGEDYHLFNDLECKSLKHQLQQIEGRRPGRVRLSAFYKKGLYSHWRFTEKVDYLRSLGALDESDATQPQVILPNYLMARTNCLEASDLYALCCQNECEDLMGHLEQAIGAPEASADRIAELVAVLPSATVVAPRNLSAVLLGRLTQVAERNGGAVPLHGRLFSQWMHHAFPRECPYPHEAGTTAPQTPDEWMLGTGHQSTVASKEEMLRHVEGDAGDEGECAELPWSDTEELISARSALPPRFDASRPHAEGAQGSGSGAFTLLSAVTAVAFACAIVLDYYYTSRHSCGLLDKDPAVAAGLRAVLACISLGSAACALGLLDKTVFVIALCAGVCARTFHVSALKAPVQKHTKCSV